MVSRAPHRAPGAARARALAATVAGALLVGACSGDAEAPFADALDPSAGAASTAVGRALAAESGCVACHGTGGAGGVGPAWRGLAGSIVELDDGTTVVADRDYLRRAILEPGADRVVGFTVRMPENALTEDEVEAIVDYVESL